MCLDLIALAIVSAAVSGLPGLFMTRTSVWSERTTLGIMTVATLSGMAGSVPALIAEGVPHNSALLWYFAGGTAIGLDPLSAFFLIPVFLVGGLGSIYGLGYWSQKQHPENGRKVRLFWGLLVAGMALLVVSRHAMVFLMGWEVMALSAFFLVSAEDERSESRQAGWHYLAATHVSTLTLFALFAIWRSETGSYYFHALGDHALTLGMMNTIFFLALVGFGLKAGMMPLHFWLPGAHANAPSHVSAMLSGVVLKMGIYGLLRVLSLLPAPPSAWGGLILALGTISGLLGVVFALGQHDLKRLLAYHSIENIGIILMGLGLAMLGCSDDRPEWVVLGLSGSLLHVWNHGLFKSLLFLCAGSVLHGAHSRQIDRLGGLAKGMPWTAAFFVLGAAAICGLPPLNGFVSELFVYLGLFRSFTSLGSGGAAAALAAPVLAMMGALAVACFVKVCGAVFLGTPRSAAATEAQESPLIMRAPMAVLAACCFLIGVMPVLVCPILDRVIASWSPANGIAIEGVAVLAPVTDIAVLAIALLLGAVTVSFMISYRCRVAARVGTWDCGFARPTSRMQYTAASFAYSIVSMFAWILRPRVHPARVEGPFPKATEMSSHVDDAVLDRVLVPGWRSAKRRIGWFRRFQQGLTQQYLLYILIAVILMLGTLIPVDRMVERLFER